jgi:hypothetical protein
MSECAAPEAPRYRDPCGSFQPVLDDIPVLSPALVARGLKVEVLDGDWLRRAEQALTEVWPAAKIDVCMKLWNTFLPK